METELLFAKQPFCYESHHFWVMSYGNWELSYQICQSKRPLKFQLVTWFYDKELSLKADIISQNSFLKNTTMCGQKSIYF